MTIVGFFLVTILFTVAGIVFYRGFTNIEKAEAQKEVKRVLQILRNEERFLSDTAADYSGWDDTYAFIRDSNRGYIESNLTESTFSKLKLNLLILVDLSGEIRFGTEFDLKQNKKIPVSESLKKHLTADSPLLKSTDIPNAQTGILLLPEGPMIICSQPILTSQYQGPIRGTLIMGRKIDDQVIRKLEDLSKSSVSLHRIDGIQQDHLNRYRSESSKEEEPVRIKTIGNDLLQGESVIRDIYGKPALFLDVDIPREMLVQAKLTLTYFFISFMLIATLFIIAVTILVHRIILSRLHKLSLAVRNINVDQGTFPILKLSGNDEMTMLNQDINTLVEKVGEYQGRMKEARDVLHKTNQQLEREVEEHRRTLMALQESESKFRGLSEKSIVGIYLYQDERFKYVNAEFANIFGYETEEIAGVLGLKDLIFPEDLPLVEENIRKKISGEEESIRYEFRIITKDQETKHAEVYSSRTTYQGRAAVIGTLLDITERKRMEENRRQLEERLQRAEKMEALGLLTGGVAHDLNNVLGASLGYSDLLLYEVEESSPFRDYVTNIRDASRKAAAIIQDMLTIARRGVQSPEVVNLNVLVQEFLKTPELERILFFHPEVRIETSLETSPLNIMGSPHQLGKTIMNLVSNAAEAMPKGGLLTIKISNQYLDRPIQGYDEVREGDYVVLSVSDTGEGISAYDIKRIFEPFYTKKVMGRSGTGLGLSVVWGTVKDHDGYIDVQSVEGQGSTFTLYFPVTREELSESHTTVSMSEYMGRGESILIVDDIEAQRELAARMLEKLNYRVRTAPSGEAAVEYMKDHRADLLVLDMIMDPGMDGLDTYRKIVEIHPRQKTIIVSGYSETDRVKGAQALGAGVYVRKPYALEMIGLAVKRELNEPK